MQIKKPNFWDLEKPNFFSILLLPFTIILLLNNFLLNHKTHKKNEKIKQYVLVIYIWEAPEKLQQRLKFIKYLKN